MNSDLSRRSFLAAALSSFAIPAIADAPQSSLRPLARGSVPAAVNGARLVRDARLSGRVGFALYDVAKGELIDVYEEYTPIAPASVAKAMTASYALDTLGKDHVFHTVLTRSGEVVDGTLLGDLVLRGGGDPTLNTDRLGSLVEALRAAGIWRIAGRFVIDAGPTPLLREIDPTQPPQVAYNPSVAGLNLNYNRIRFDWRRAEGAYHMTMRASGKRYEPDVVVSRILPSNTNGPVYEHRLVDGGEEWLVKRGALGSKGGRWLPTRVPLLQAGEAFRGIARRLQILLPAPVLETGTPTGTEIARTTSEPLTDIAQDMLKFSTNLTAEALGLAASGADSLPTSANAMTTWCLGQGLAGQFVDHSGLGSTSKVTAAGLAQFMAAQPRDRLKPILKDMSRDNQGRSRANGASVRAKTGSLNFVSTLSGYLTVGGREFTFGILTDDMTARSKIAPNDRERPAGAGSWNSRSRRLQYGLLKHWATGV